ncbi:uncharacterized protein LOC121781451 [Salvia splendens]|uniref:uncharacterized protein LOC121781451 n=1 Tax=Salvia splendens TaxID=180675 RepID=UPI001C281424|nr:uncharacterized protein LOC121781451 [Salvia splendens]
MDKNQHRWSLLGGNRQGRREGLVRDGGGNILAAFVTPLEAHSTLEAEILAIHHGIALAKEFRRPMWVESDAEQATKLLTGTEWGPAHIRQVMARLFILKQQHNNRITFIHKEGNKAADFLAKMGLEQASFLCMSTQTAPRMLKAIVRMDAMGIPNLRLREDVRE